MIFSVLLYFVCAEATLYSIDDSRPHLVSEGVTLDFTGGGPAFMLASNMLTRINYRGIRSLAQTTLVTTLKGWSVYTCNLSTFALCETEWGYVFPPGTPADGSSIYHQFHCSNSIGKNSVSSTNYDMSACDVLDESLDLVYTQNLLYVKKNNMNAVEYWILILSSVYLVRALSLNIMSKLKNDTTTYQHMYTLVCFVVWVILLYEWDSTFVTVNDQAFYWVNIMYIFGYLVFHAYHSIYRVFIHSKHIEPRIFNLAAACIQGVVMALYGGAETPYVIVVIAMIMVRIWEKENQKRIMHVITGMIDCMYISLLIYVGYAYEVFYLYPIIMFSKMVSDHWFVTSLSL